MEQITLGQIASAVALIAGLITGASLIVGSLKKWLTATLTEKFNGIDVRLDDLNDRLDDVAMNHCKDFLVQILSSAERGEALTDIERLRFSEEYDNYVNHGGNSYIREWYQKLHAKELI